MLGTSSTWAFSINTFTILFFYYPGRFKVSEIEPNYYEVGFAFY